MDNFIYEVYMLLSILMFTIGISIHFAKKWRQIKNDTGVQVNPVKYFSDNPYHTAITVLGGIAGLVILHTTGQLIPATALGLGFAADSCADTLGTRAINKVNT